MIALEASASVRPKTPGRSHGPHLRPSRAPHTPVHAARHPPPPLRKPGHSPRPWPPRRTRPSTGTRTQVNPCPSGRGPTSLILSPSFSSNAARGSPRDPHTRDPPHRCLHPAVHSMLQAAPAQAHWMDPRRTSPPRATTTPVQPHRRLAWVLYHCRFPRHQQWPSQTSSRPLAPHACQPLHHCIFVAARAM